MTELQSLSAPVALAPVALNDTKHLVRLRHTHRLAFERYIDLASKICGRLGTLTPESLSNLDRANLGAAKRMEADAHAAYLRARGTLIDYLAGALTTHAHAGD